MSAEPVVIHRAPSRRVPRREVLAVIVAALFLCGAAAERLSLPRESDSAEYHRSVREAAARVPETIGEWVGEHVPVPAEATALLRPNVLVSRRFTNAVSGRSVSFLLVQCRDVRDLVPHYPPVCYPGQGLELKSTRQRTHDVDGFQLTSTQYGFESNTFRQAQPLVVENFMLLPIGKATPDMEAVREQVALKNRFFGAAQVQVVANAYMPEPERDAVFDELIQGYRPVLNAILNGVGE